MIHVLARFGQGTIYGTYVGEALKAFSGVDDLETIGDALVHRGVGLKNRAIRRELRSTCLRHLTISRGHMAAWVRPQAKIPPAMHLA